MKKLMTVVLALALMAPATALAQDAGDAGIFWDPAGTISEGALPVFVPTNLYVIVFDAAGDVGGYEGSISADPTLLLLSTILAGPGPLNVGDPTNFIVGAGGCIASAGATTMITYQYGNFTGVPVNDALFCLGASTPSSFAPAAPGYLSCDGDLFPFGVAQNGSGVVPNGCAIANSTNPPGTVVGTVETSFGAVKAGF